MRRSRRVAALIVKPVIRAKMLDIVLKMVLLVDKRIYTTSSATNLRQAFWNILLVLLAYAITFQPILIPSI
jgi:hypothetical protein